MSNLSITEYRSVGRDVNGSPLPAGLAPAVTIQNVTFTATAAASNAFNDETVFVRIVADADCRIVFGTAPTATSTDTLMVAGNAEYFGVKAGLKVSAIEVV